MKKHKNPLCFENILTLLRKRGLFYNECADVAGIEVPTTPGRRQEGPDRRTMLDVMQAAQDFFVAALASPAGAEARATFVKRGYDEEAQRTLGLGFHQVWISSRAWLRGLMHLSFLNANCGPSPIALL